LFLSFEKIGKREKRKKNFVVSSQIHSIHAFFVFSEDISRIISGTFRARKHPKTDSGSAHQVNQTLIMCNYSAEKMFQNPKANPKKLKYLRLKTLNFFTGDFNPPKHTFFELFQDLICITFFPFNLDTSLFQVKGIFKFNFSPYIFETFETNSAG
jgi:hypothetical protein